MEETGHVIAAAGAKVFADSVSKALYDSLQKVAEGRLISYTQAQAEIKRLQAAMTETDTSFTYKDKWLTVDVKKPSGGKPALLDATYDAELNWMWYRDRKNWFSPLRTYGRFWLSDPQATIRGVKHLRIEPPADNLGLSVQVIGDYYRGEARMGAGITLRAGRVRLQGAYLNGFEGGWHPYFRGSYDLISW